MGLRSVSKKSCSAILKEGSGNSVCIVVGGAAESLSAHPGTADLTLLKRYVGRFKERRILGWVLMYLGCTGLGLSRLHCNKGTALCLSLEGQKDRKLIDSIEPI